MKVKKKPLHFIHLHVYSSYSLLESSISVDNLIAYALKEKAPAIALTDKNNLFGALEFTEKCFKAGIQPIIGCEFSLCFDEEEQTGANLDKALSSILLLAANQEGYQNLMKLSSFAFLGKSDEKVNDETFFSPHIKAQWLAEYSRGLIALTSGNSGVLTTVLKRNNFAVARERCLFLKQIFEDRLYIELQRLDASYDKQTEALLVELAYDLEIPLVATNESYFPKKGDHVAHAALLAIADGQALDSENSRTVSEGCYLKSVQEMCDLFDDLPEALENTVEIAQRCSAFSPNRAPILPRFSSDETADLKDQAEKGLKSRLTKLGLAEGYEILDYQKRLAYELKIIERMGFSGYFLIVADFIRWAKEHNIPVGPGRGSGAGSLVAYALMITNIDPLRFSLLFERFLNPERVSMPDFDIDFCQEGRERVIDYVTKKYSAQQVAQIITFGSLQARGVLRDVGRVLSMPYSQVDRICKLIPQEVGVQTGLKVLLKTDELKSLAQDPMVARLYGIAQELEGLYRHASTHAAGIVIGDRDLSELVPLYRDPRSSMQVTQFNMKYVEKAGLVKFDFLGLKTLSVLKEALRLIRSKNIIIDLDQIPLDDQKTYALLSKAHSLGVFQLESTGMRDTLLQMRPDCIEDLIALVALYRPGPMENIPDYAARKHGKKPIESIHKAIDPLLKETQGVIVYQEQVMEIAQILAGYSLGEADLLRRAMGKKIHAEMAQQRDRFQEGAVKNGIEAKKAAEIFDLLAKFADYGFNKSHAAAYALIAYQTAYLKTYYTAEFLAASMSYDLTNTEKLDEFRQEAKRFSIEVVAPSVRHSFAFFEVRDEKIYYALAAIKGVGIEAAEYIAKIREEGNFKNLEDFFKRIDRKKLNKRALESLIKAGALDCFGYPRDRLFENIETIYKWMQLRQDIDEVDGQNFLFSVEEILMDKALILAPLAKAWTMQEKLTAELKVLGFYLSGHPLEIYNDFLQQQAVVPYSEIKNNETNEETVKLAGTLIAKALRRTKSGKRLAVLLFSDRSTSYELLMFEDQLESYENKLEVGKSYLLDVVRHIKEGEFRLSLYRLECLEEKIEKYYQNLTIKFKAFKETNIKSLVDLLNHYKMPAPLEGNPQKIYLLVEKEEKQDSAIHIELPNIYKITTDLVNSLKQKSDIEVIDLKLKHKI